MNRKERRAKKVKNNDPTVTLKQSEIKAYIDRLIKEDLSVKKVIDEEVHKKGLLEVKKQAEDIDAIILMSLHETYGMGKTRLLKFVAGLEKLQKYYEDMYEDCDLFAMKLHLKEKVGIDVTNLYEEVDKLAKEDNTP